MNKAIHDRKCRDRYAVELKCAELLRKAGIGITKAGATVGIDARTLKHYLPTGWRDARRDNRGPARDTVKRANICRRRRDGWSVAYIAQVAGISRQRVYQILAEERA